MPLRASSSFEEGSIAFLERFLLEHKVGVCRVELFRSQYHFNYCVRVMYMSRSGLTTCSMTDFDPSTFRDRENLIRFIKNHESYIPLTRRTIE